MKVSGVISDAYGKTDGATIQLHRNGQGTNLAVISNQNGYFEIENEEIKPNDDFHIRYLGLKNKVIKAKNLKDAEIFLDEDIDSLDEVIITNDIGKTPNSDITVTKYKKRWYNSPVFIISTLGLFTTGIIIYIIKKTK